MAWERLSAQERAQYTLPACLIIMDGFGNAEPGPGNAISLANKPNLDAAFAAGSVTEILTSGEAVGLPEGQMGNSEVGHLNIGAGRVVHQELSRINYACADGSIKTNPVIGAAFEAAKAEGSALHFMGLMSDGGVHSTNAHLYALMDAAKEAGVTDIYVHCFMDGRDVPPKSGAGYIDELAQKCASVSDASCTAQIASIEGRYYAMDRDNRWDRVAAAYNAIVHAQPCVDETPAAIMEQSYAADVTDEFVVPVACCDRGVKSGDAVVFFNFRPDRARQITRAFVEPDFEGFDRGDAPSVSFVCLTEYDATIDAPVAFPKEFPENVLADVLSSAGLAQFHTAETEKYAHVTFFMNGGREDPKPGEQRRLVASPKVATYDLQPEMSAPDVAQGLADAILNDEADVFIVNFANCDMVGHTGVIPAAVAAVEAVDAGVGKVLDALRERGGCALVTADHGNADKMLAEDGTPFTAHTTNPVPLALVNYSDKPMKLDGTVGSLSNLSPTLLEMIGLEAPAEMTARSLLA